MKTVWGTSNIENKRIRLNLELAKKSEQCLEYIIVHEMVHFLERDHNSRFVAYMDKFIPKWKLYKNELNSEILAHEKW
jgi:predicted metal-dependent hydrolase